MSNTITTEVCHIAVNIGECNGLDQSQIYIQNIDLIKWDLPQYRITQLFEIAEEVPQIKKVFIDSARRMRLDRLMIAEKVRQNAGRL